MELNLEKIRKERPMQDLIRFSIINLNKPTGPTSFDVSQFVKDILKINKTSHFGTLDPMVTGVLPIGLSRACRLSDYFMHSDKEYVGIMHLHKDIQDEELNQVLQQFLGKIMQLPPVKSRVKRELREREIKSFKILERNNKDVLFITDVQAGTYIRKLISDMGEKIGGAHMLELRRTRASIFKEADSVNLYDLEKGVGEYKSGNESLLRNLLIPADYAISLVLPVVQIKESFIKQALTGKPLSKNNLTQKPSFEKEQKIAIFCNEQFIQVASVINEGDVIAKPEFVCN
jgi:H/ACA ribonucleoprotein complex subunit 4